MPGRLLGCWGEGWVLWAGRRRIAHIPANLSPAAPDGECSSQQSSQASDEALTPSPLQPRGCCRARRQWERGIHPQAKHTAASLPP